MKSIKENQDFLKEIYGNCNSRYNFDYLFGFLARYAIMERDIYTDTTINIKCISYIIAIANLFDIDLQDEFIKKFPSLCPYCLNIPCQCLRSGKKPYNNQISAKDPHHELKYSYDQQKCKKEKVTFESLYEMLINIYPNNLYDWVKYGRNRHIVKLGEEISELHEACCRYLRLDERKDIFRRSMCDEIADVFAWSLSEWGLASNGANMSDSFESFYSKGCSKCGQKPCSCKIRSESPRSLIAEDLGNNALNIIDILSENFENSSKHMKTLLALRNDLYIAKLSGIERNILRVIRNINDTIIDIFHAPFGQPEVRMHHSVEKAVTEYLAKSKVKSDVIYK